MFQMYIWIMCIHWCTTGTDLLVTKGTGIWSLLLSLVGNLGTTIIRRDSLLHWMCGNSPSLVDILVLLLCVAMCVCMHIMCDVKLILCLSSKLSLLLYQG